MEHLWVGMRLAVASSHSEFIRITTPVAPHNDSILKKVLQLIVDSLCGLHDVEGRTFGNRAKT